MRNPASLFLRIVGGLVALFVAYVAYDVIYGFQYEVLKDAAGLFEQQECRTGRMASDTADYLEAAAPEERSLYQEVVGHTGVWCRVRDNGEGGYLLRVEGRYVVPFSVEAPLRLENREWCRQQQGAQAGQGRDR